MIVNFICSYKDYYIGNCDNKSYIYSIFIDNEDGTHFIEIYDIIYVSDTLINSMDEELYNNIKNGNII